MLIGLLVVSVLLLIAGFVSLGRPGSGDDPATNRAWRAGILLFALAGVAFAAGYTFGADLAQR